MSILQLATDAYEQHLLDHDFDVEDDEAPIRAVLRALSEYIRTNHYRSEGRAIAVLFDAAAGPEPFIDEPHIRKPSLSVGDSRMYAS